MLWKSLSNRPVRLKEQAIQVTGLIVWVERWITEEARAQGMLNVFVVEMWDIKLTITDAQLEGNSAENVMGLNIDMRHLTVFCRFLRRNCTKVANIVSPLHALFFGARSKWERWAHPTHSGSQSGNRIRFVFPRGAASYMINTVINQL